MEAQQITITTELQQLITSEQAWHYRIVPKSVNGSNYSFFLDEEGEKLQVQRELAILLNGRVELECVDSAVIQQLLSQHYRKTSGNNTAKKVNFNQNASESFLVNLLNEAKEIGSSDIHIEVYEARCRVRMRIDGHLIERYVIQKLEYPSLINKIKIKSHLDIAEKRLPQDGRIQQEIDGKKLDVRVSVLPTLHGEKIVLRLLSNDATNIELSSLGFFESELQQYLEGIKKPYGIVLISGPTGSGKTTTLYATLKILNEVKNNILTVEDPIEYTIEGINQVLVRENIGLTFASALKSFLRQDPDVIMLGEIRDSETANMAIRASLTGHLVLSTIHTNSAWGTISRLVDMGVPSYLLAGTMNTSVAQRLVRLLCPNCKTTKPFDGKLYPLNYQPPRKISEHTVATGCDSCYYTGYKGRKAIYEIIPITNELANKIKHNEFDISAYRKANNLSTLQENAFELFATGKTSLDEVYPILTQH